MNQVNVRVLYAEDDVALRQQVAIALRHWGCRIDEVKDVQQAKSALQEEVFDIILLDLRLPEHNPRGGTQVLQFMKERKIVTPVILVTAYGHNGLALEAKKTYPEVVRGVVGKSFASEDVFKAIQKALSEPVD